MRNGFGNLQESPVRRRRADIRFLNQDDMIIGLGDIWILNSLRKLCGELYVVVAIHSNKIRGETVTQKIRQDKTIAIVAFLFCRKLYVAKED
jgi:hypothetical protein